MNDTKIKVLLVEPEKYPKEIVIDDSLEAMQEVVGGDIEEYMHFRLIVLFMCRTTIRKRWLILSAASSLSVMHRLRVRAFRACRTI